MSPRRLALLGALAILGALAAAPAASAAPTPPELSLDFHSNQTNFPPGGQSQFWIDVGNVGGTETSGPLIVHAALPTGMTFVEGESFFGPAQFGELVWSCVATLGNGFECTSSGGNVPRHATNRQLVVTVAVDPSASGNLATTATVEGGGSAPPASTVEYTTISPTPAAFGIVPSSFTPDFFESDARTPVTEAGAHPDLFIVPFDFNTKPTPVGGPLQSINSAPIRDLKVDLPPGFVGNPTAVGDCTPTELNQGNCPRSSQVGKIELRLFPISPGQGNDAQPFTTGVFNMTHPHGSVADLAFNVLETPVHIRANLDPANRYAIRTEVLTINETLPVFEQKLTLWGVPADPSHDQERCVGFNNQGFGNGDTSEECSTDHPRAPFISLPSSCKEVHQFKLFDYDSWQSIGTFGAPIDYPQPELTTNCDKPRFEPEVAVEPTGHQANFPTGLNVEVKVPQNQSSNALATPPVKSVTVTLPEGMSFSPSFTDGLKSCTLAQMQLGNDNPIECPDASRIGEVTLHTPLLPNATEGSMYLAAQNDNPYGSTFALLLVLHDTEERGVLLKIPGKIEVNETTGQIKTVFDNAPQFPFDNLTLKFRSGVRAPLVSPPTCGKQQIGVEIASYAQPNNPVDVSNTYNVTEGPNGTPCPPDAAHRPFQPTTAGGTLNPVAGAYSTFLFRVSREDSEQPLGQVSTTLPQGLLANISKIPYCSDAAIASISSALGTAQQELEHPACPVASQIGTISAGLGSGPGPYYFDGSVYLAGPYKGAPLSLAIVVPGLAGPYDLGSVVVRAAIQINPITAQVTAVSDPFPRILHGVLLPVRDVRVRLDRPDTAVNPTSCAPMSVGFAVLSTFDALSTSKAPFQVSSCSALAFNPKLGLKLSGQTTRGKDPALRAVLTQPKGQANIGRVSVVLPKSEFIDNRHINSPCTRVQFEAGAGNGSQCPAKSILGYAKAFSPLLADPLEGPVYFRSNGGERKLPDLVAALHGQFEINLVGFIDSVRTKGSEVSRVRNTFAIIPDAPVTKFILNLKGGKKGLLQNSANLCKVKNIAQIKMTGQNGKPHDFGKAIANDCGGGKKNNKKTAKSRSSRQH